VVKGLALVNQKPVFGISSLDALAFSCGPARDRVCAMIDAGRHEVYCARYERFQGILTKCSREAVVSPEAVITEIAHPTLWIGSGALSYRKMIEEKHGESAFFPDPEDHIIRASAVAFLAMAPMPGLPSVVKKDQGAHVLPHYIRDSDARLQAKAKP
jgi:tRNA threonylcarbamoyladenosine biosynthesis protein TsaB